MIEWKNKDLVATCEACNYVLTITNIEPDKNPRYRENVAQVLNAQGWRYSEAGYDYCPSCVPVYLKDRGN